MKQHVVGFVFVAINVFVSTQVSADLILEFGQSAYTINGVGQAVAVDVYLTQNGETTLEDFGLQLAAFRLDYGSSTPSAKVQAIGDVSAHIDFDDYVDVTINPESVILDAGSNGSMFPPVADPNRILLATFTFTGISAGLTTLTAQDIDTTIGNDSFFSAFGPLDSSITFNKQATINVTSVPEPNSLALLSLGLLSALLGGTRRRRHSHNAFNLPES